MTVSNSLCTYPLISFKPGKWNTNFIFIRWCMYLFCFLRFLVDIWKIHYSKCNCLIHSFRRISKNLSKTFLFIILGHIISFKKHFKNIYWFFQNKSHSKTYFNLCNALNNNKMNWDTPVNYFFCRAHLPWIN